MRLPQGVLGPFSRVISTRFASGEVGRMSKKNLLVTTDLLDRVSIKQLSRYANVFLASAVGKDELATLLPSVDAMMIFSWPKFLKEGAVSEMGRLRFIQSILAGVNHIPFNQLDKQVTVSSNAGAYSGPVAEYAWGLLLSAAKRIVEHHTAIREGRGVLVRHGDAAQGVYILKGKTLGVLGYGGIGTVVARIARAFEMKVVAFTRRSGYRPGVTFLQGERGLDKTLKESDAIVLALPLTKATTRVIDKDRLSLMKERMVLVNVARGELVDEEALYHHLKANPDFRYATDVWWYRDGRESLSTSYDFASLPNFVGVPHVSGPSGLATGQPVKIAVENTLRFLRNQQPNNIVDRTDYTG